MRTLTLIAVALTFVVVVVGAYVRLSDAGLGCPDWPFCYGKPLPADIADQDALAKAWKEMGHRYLAGTLGIVIAAIWILSFLKKHSRWLATAAAVLVVFQATLGKWTVTMLLKPAIVTAHLLGGMTILALLLWLWLSLGRWRSHTPGLKAPALLALLVLSIQVALGGWVSANYAALACPDLPLCLGQAVPPMDFASAFHVVRELGQAPDGALLSGEALTAIHWTHRAFAVVAFAIIGWTALRVLRVMPSLGWAIGILLLLQIAIGIANVALSLPLALAAAHNAGAALLLCAIVVLNFFSFRKLS
jgi:cytochrome c oxidase assembly protein subunit 15